LRQCRARRVGNALPQKRGRSMLRCAADETRNRQEDGPREQPLETSMGSKVFHSEFIQK